MRVVNRLLDEQRKKKPAAQTEPDEVEITMELPVQQPINAAASVYDRGVAERFGGINTKPSVFDEKARFRPKN